MSNGRDLPEEAKGKKKELEMEGRCDGGGY
jgi:hypothetical protein